MPSAFNKKELKLLALLMLLGLMGLFAFIKLYPHSFPSASLNFKINRQQAARQAESWLKTQGYNLKGYLTATIFDYDQQGQSYLEQKLGLKTAEQRLSGKSPIWYWQVRWFKPLHKEEFEVALSPEGKLNYFSRKIKEDSPGANLTPQQALELAQQALLRCSGLSASRCALISSNATKLPQRTDYDFTWEEQNFPLAEARLRYSVSLQGDVLGGFNYWLKIPESFGEAQDQESSKGQSLAFAATFFAYFLGLLLFISFVLALAKKKLQWKFLLGLGIALGLIKLTGDCNALPLSLFYFNTTSSLSYFLTSQAGAIIIGSVAAGLFIIFLGSGASLFYQDAFPQHQSFRRAFSLEGILSTEFLKAVPAGYSIAFIHLAYVATFYWAGAKFFGIWSPTETPYENFLSTYLPWIYPLTLGAFAALQEEFFFRLFGISVIKKYLKATWVAILIPAMVWAFMHCNYPQQPFYIRGIELTVVGIILGLGFKKYGIWCPLISHYVVNASLGSGLLLKSTSLYFKLSALLVCLLPLLVALAVFLSKKYAAAEPELPTITEAETLPEIKPPVLPVFSYNALPPSKLLKLGLGAILLLGLYLAASAYIKIPEYRGRPDFFISRAEARLEADNWLKRVEIPTSGFNRIAFLSANPNTTAGKFFLRRLGTAATNDWLKDFLPSYGWRVKYFKPLHKESMQLLIDGKGAVQEFTRTLPEDAPGSSLNYSQALEQAENFLFYKGNLDIFDFRLQDTYNDIRPHRKDYSFTWERKASKLQESSLRTSVTLQGDKPGYWSKWVKLPEAWIRDEAKSSLKDSLAQITLAVIGLAFILWLAILFIKALSARQLRWRLSLSLAAVLTAVNLLQYLNNFPLWLRSYSSQSMALKVFYLTSLLGLIMALAGGFLLWAALIALAEALYRKAFPQHPDLSGWIAEIFRGNHNWMRKEAFILSVLAYCGALFWAGGWNYLQENYFRTTLTPELASLGGWDSFIPALQLLLSGFEQTLLSVVLIMLLAALAKLKLKSAALGALLCLGAYILAHLPEIKTGAEAVWVAVSAVTLIAAIWLLLSCSESDRRQNFLALCLFLFCAKVLPDAWLLMQQPLDWFRWNGFAVIILSLAGAGWLLIPKSGVKPPAPAYSLPENPE